VDDVRSEPIDQIDRTRTGREDGGLDAFISYSHRDSDFVHELKDALEAAGHVVWIDADDIPAGAPWRRELGSGIEAADSFVFVLSPDSLASEECAVELRRARELGKRMIPVLLRRVDAIPPGLAEVQYVDASARAVGVAAAGVGAAMETDHDWVREHTTWLTRALRWETHGRQRGYLLRGGELRTAEEWLARQSEGLKPPPTPLQTEFVVASRQAEKRRLRLLLAAALVAVAVSLALAAFALVQRREAIAQRDQAQSRELAAAALSQLSVDPELSLLLGLEAEKTADTPETRDALRRGLVESHVQRTLRDHDDSVNDVAYSPEGDLLATASSDGTVRLVDPAVGTGLGVLETHQGGVRGVTFAPQGGLLLTRGDDATVRLWNTETGEQLSSLPGDIGSFSRDGERIATGDEDGTARVFETETGEEIARLEGEQPMTSAVFGPDGGTVLTAEGDLSAPGTPGIVRLWNVGSGESTELGSYAQPVFSAAFDRSGRRVVTVAADVTSLWDVSSGRLLKTLDMAFLARFSPDGKRLLTATNDGTARVWTATGDEVSVLRESHGSVILDAAWSEDGSLVVTAGIDQTARVWDPSTGEVIAFLRGHADAVNTAVFAPGGRTVATGSADSDARLWELGRPVVLRGHGQWDVPVEEREAQLSSVDFDPDGEVLLTAATDGTARTWDADTGRELLRPPGCESVSEVFSCLAAAVGLGHVSFITEAEFGPDGKTVLTTGEDGSAQVWNATSGVNLARFAESEGPAWGASFDPRGTRVVVAGEDGIARIGDVGTGGVLFELRGHDGPVTDAVFSPDGSLVLTSGQDNTLRLWDAGQGTEQRVLAEGAGDVGGIAFSPDGSLVAAPADQDARVFDVESGAQVALLRGHSGLVQSTSFSPDGDFVVTSSLDRTARVWDVRAGTEVLVLRGHRAGISSAAFSPDGARVATGAQDATARIWECEPCVPDDRLVELARSSVTRELTPAERERYVAR
jgi:WD40 repeat protein